MRRGTEYCAAAITLYNFAFTLGKRTAETRPGKYLDASLLLHI